MKKIILIYWDQLTCNISSLKEAKSNDIVVFVECVKDSTIVKHHKKKLVFLLSSMRTFANEINEKFNIEYFKVTDDINTIESAIRHVSVKHKIREVCVTHPGEYHQLKTIKDIAINLSLKLSILEDDRFLCSKKEFSKWISTRKTNSQIIMESFYRDMRKKTGLLVEEDKPVGGKWNFDKDNRNYLPDNIEIPKIDGFKPSNCTLEVISDVNLKFSDHFGDIAPFWYATSRKDAEIAFERFIDIALVNFGMYQDAMMTDQAFLFHSVISQYINIGFLDPLEVCKRIEFEYIHNKIALNCAEGFIRQVIGWREYIRGIYWYYMPEYKNLNTMEYKRKLPSIYWGSETKMKCISEVVKSTKIHAYSHHIQRLMITGNFATLTGILPKEIHEWYLIVYIDAFEWVELPNTIGMATFSDGGLVGTKPYISGGNYISKMSNFCDNCQYKVKVKTGKDACPFNYLYWNYLIENRDKLKNNLRLKMPISTLNKMSNEKIKQIKKDSAIFLEKIENNDYI